jgi:hypothetical protein
MLCLYVPTVQPFMLDLTYGRVKDSLEIKILMNSSVIVCYSLSNIVY